MDIYAFSNAELVSMLGRRFKDYRIRCRLTQKELAEITGVSVPTIRNFENGKSYNVSLHVLLSLMRAVGQLEQIESVLPELPVSPKDIYEKKKTPKRVKHGKKSLRKLRFQNNGLEGLLKKKKK